MEKSKNILLSIIIPVYNVEDYVERCIRSIKDDKLSSDDFEIIIVNDGSPDNSVNIIEKLKGEITNIILINQKNAGVSVARNVGINRASGEYIIFIDPDDYINPNLLKKLYDRAKQDNLDILLCGRSIIKENGEVIHLLGYEDKTQKIYDGVEGYNEKNSPLKVNDNCWGRLFRNELIKKYEILFPISVPHLEDGVFNRKIFSVAERVGFENFDFYQVFERPGSASRSDLSFSMKAIKGDILSSKDLKIFKKKHELSDSQLGLINASIIKYSLMPIMRSINAKNIQLLLSCYKLLKMENLIPLNIEYVPNGNLLNLGKAFNKSIWHFIYVFYFKKK